MCSACCSRATGLPPSRTAGALVAAGALGACVAAGVPTAACSPVGETGWAMAEGGGVSVSPPCTPITLQVAGPTMPSTVSPWRACSRRIAASVSGRSRRRRGGAARAAAARRRSGSARGRRTRGLRLRGAGAPHHLRALRGRRPSVRLRGGFSRDRALHVRRECRSGTRAAQCGARQWADDAVDGEPVARLEVRTAASVSGPKMPSTLMPRAPAGAVRTCRPSLPSLSTMLVRSSSPAPGGGVAGIGGRDPAWP